MLKITQLVYFCAVVEEGTVASAAKKCHCVAANITLRLKELEAQLGVHLFYREKSRLFVTPEGRMLYKKAKEIIALHSETLQIFSVEGMKGILNIGALDAVLSNQLPEVISSIREEMSEVIFNIRTGHSFDLERALLEGSLDLIISDGPVEHPLMEGVLIFEEKLMLITPSIIEKVDSRSMVEKELYVFGKNCFYRDQVDSWAHINDIKPRLVMEFESYAVMLSCVKKGLGCAFIPESFSDKVSDVGGVRMHFNIIKDVSDLYLIRRRGFESSIVKEFSKRIMAQAGRDPR